MSDAVCRILVVEDEPLIRQLLHTALTVRGHEVVTSADGEGGLLLLQQSRFDVVLTDYRMPKMTGIEMIAAVRALKMNLATILMSSNTLEELALTARELQGIQFLRKPFGINELYSCVQRALKSSSR